ncbi:MAG: molecular chaperone TorD family protein [Myxococcales bacterium]|nr:molecular chaperone TorD family protein [Myxococcales bacterium]MCB9524238.1 molecular chaperone TorD family protein [Myxococcales bacterium]
MSHPTDATARGNLYGFFSRLFVKELDAAAVELLWSPLGHALLPRFYAGDEAKHLADADARVRVFDADFVHLTVVNVVPYASFYRRDDARVESGGANPISDWLSQYGFEVDLVAARSLSQDHIGIVLEVMATLCVHEAEAEARPDAEYAAHIRGLQREFLREHVLSWAPVYLFAVERSAHTALYREAAEACVAWLGADFQALTDRA